MPEAVLDKKTYREIAIRHLSGEELKSLSQEMKLSLSREDMEAVQEDWSCSTRLRSDP